MLLGLTDARTFFLWCRYLPGERTKSIKISAVTSVGDVVRQLCTRLGVDTPGEYGVYVLTVHSEFGTLLQAKDYILDTTTILEKRKMPYKLHFRKVPTRRYPNL
jgi:hypothetical protein